ncbi:MAG TPA: magnesium transporter, partial [Halomonas sp.]|nr:magnesium transporter [Halomonas sp.]
MRDEEKYTNTEEQLLYLQKLLDEEDTAALNELFNELDILAIARTLESFPAKTRDLLWEYIPETMLGEVLAEVDEDIRADYIEDLTASDVE